MKKTEKRKQFLGKLGYSVTNKETGKVGDFMDKVERNFQNKHLKAYLRGDEYFTFGRNSNTGDSEWFKVLYTYE